MRAGGEASASRGMQALWVLAPVLMFALVALVSIAWLARDRAPLVFDPAAHVAGSVEFARDPVASLRFERQVYPPLGHALTGAVLRLDGYRVDAAIGVVGLAFLAVMLFATYGIGRELHSARAGAIAAVLLGLYPATFIHARSAMLDLPTAAIATASVYALIRSCGLTERRWVVALGVLGGLGWLTKQSYPIAIAGPLLYVALTAPRRARTYQHLALAIGIALLLSLPWYLPRVGWFVGDYASAQSAYAGSRGDPETWSVFGLAYYFIGTWHQTSFVFAVVFAAALAPFALGARRGLLLSWWLGVVALTTLLDLKDSRFLLPALPAIALMTAIGLCELQRRRVIDVLVVALVLFGVVQMWAASFGIGALPQGEIVVNRPESDERPQWFAQNYRLTLGESSQADRSGWGTGGGIGAIAGRVGVVGDRVVYDAVNIPRYVGEARAGRLLTRAEFVTCANPAAFARYDVIVVQVGGRGSPGDAAATEACVRGLGLVLRVPLDVRGLLGGATAVDVYRVR